VFLLLFISRNSGRKIALRAFIIKLIYPKNLTPLHYFSLEVPDKSKEKN